LPFSLYAHLVKQAGCVFACPPEDVGGMWVYEEFLEAMADHDELLEWAGGTFDPEALAPAAASKVMQQGLPDWRSERWV
jgi:hypothetical protein